MMNEIFHHGPIVCSMATPEVFDYEYRGGIYTQPDGDDVDHDVEVVGWGEEDGVPYWHVSGGDAGMCLPGGGEWAFWRECV